MVRQPHPRNVDFGDPFPHLSTQGRKPWINLTFYNFTPGICPQESITLLYPCLNMSSKMLTVSIRIMRANPLPLRTPPFQGRMFQKHCQRKIRRPISCVHLEIFQNVLQYDLLLSQRKADVTDFIVISQLHLQRPHQEWRYSSRVSTRKTHSLLDFRLVLACVLPTQTNGSSRTVDERRWEFPYTILFSVFQAGNHQLSRNTFHHPCIKIVPRCL